MKHKDELTKDHIWKEEVRDGTTKIPVAELRTLGDNIKKGTRVLEFGDKRNPTGLYREWYIKNGAEYWCTDINGKNGAIVWDWREEIVEEIKNLMPFDVVTNFGCTEHVQTDEGQEACWKNIHSLIKVGGILCSVTPEPKQPRWANHGKNTVAPGVYYPWPKWHENMAELNGYEIEDLWTRGNETPLPHLVCVRMRKVEDKEFSFTMEDMYKNP